MHFLGAPRGSTRRLTRPACASGAVGPGQPSPENRSQAACLDTPSAAPMRVQLTPREARAWLRQRASAVSPQGAASTFVPVGHGQAGVPR